MELAWCPVAVGNTHSACSVSLALHSGVWSLLRNTGWCCSRKVGLIIESEAHSFPNFYTLIILVDWDLNNILSWLRCAWEMCGSNELAAEHLSFCSLKQFFFLPVVRIWIPVTVLWHAVTDFMVCTPELTDFMACSPEVMSVTLSCMCTGWCDSMPAWWLCAAPGQTLCPHASSPQGWFLPVVHQPFPLVNKIVPKGLLSTQDNPDVSTYSRDLLTPLLLPWYPLTPPPPAASLSGPKF